MAGTNSKKQDKIKQFWNKGWPLWDHIDCLMPQVEHGKYVFCPGMESKQASLDINLGAINHDEGDGKTGVITARGRFSQDWDELDISAASTEIKLDLRDIDVDSNKDINVV